MMVTDMLTAYPIWMGKYEDTLSKNGGDQEGAVLAADDAVRFSQSTANTEDLSAFLRSGQGVYRLLSLFATDNVGRYGQRQRYHYRAWRAKQMTTMGYAYANVMDAVLPAIAMRALLELFWRSQPVPDADDEERWFDFLGDVMGDVFLQGVPLASNLFSSFRKPLDSPLGALADKAVRNVKNVGKLVMDPSDMDAQERALLGIAELVSLYAKVPVTQVLGRASRGMRQYEDNDGATLFNLAIPEPRK